MKNFDELYNKHYKSVYRLAIRFLNNKENAADITQDVFLYLYNKLNKNKNIENEKAWLYKVTSNLCLAFIRKNKRIVRITRDTKNEMTEGNQSGLEVFSALKRLKESDRILLTFYNEGLSYKELAELTGIKFTSVGKTLSRALKRLKDEVERQK